MRSRTLAEMFEMMDASNVSLREHVAFKARSRVVGIAAQGAMNATMNHAQRRGFRFSCRVCGGAAELRGGRRFCEADPLHADPLGDVRRATEAMDQRREFLAAEQRLRMPTDVELCIERMEALRARFGRA